MVAVQFAALNVMSSAHAQRDQMLIRFLNTRPADGPTVIIFTWAGGKHPEIRSTGMGRVVCHFAVSSWWPHAIAWFFAKLSRGLKRGGVAPRRLAGSLSSRFVAKTLPKPTPFDRDH